MTIFQWTPKEMLKTSGAYWLSCTIHAAVKLDLFSIIGVNKLTIEQIISNCQADQRGLYMLLNALVASGLLAKDNNQFYCTPFSQKHLCKDSPDYIGYMIMHHHYLVDSWRQLDQVVLSGKPVRHENSCHTSDINQRESFLMGMFNNAMATAPLVCKNVDLNNRTHLLDLGGGPGTYAIYFCQKYPQLQATVYDLPTTRPFAEKTIHQFGLSDRIQFMDINYVLNDIQGQYDVAWLSHILHSESPDNCQQILNKAFNVLMPGSMILIHEFILNASMDSPLFPALFALNMLVGTNQGQAYSDEQIINMLKNAGFIQMKRLESKGPNDSGIIIGHKP